MSHCHTPSLTSRTVSRAWNPWASLKTRAHLRLVFAELPDECGGGAIRQEADGTRTVLLDYRLDRAARRSILGHELTHDQHDLLWPPGTPAALIDKGEDFVDRRTAERLVPLDELDELVCRLVGLEEPVRAIDVMETFDVDVDTANRALWLLGQRSA